MFFILSKVLLFLLFPLLWIFVLLLIAVFTKKPKIRRKYLIAGVLTLYLFSSPFPINLFASLWDVPPGNIQSNKVYSAEILLGGFVSEEQGRGYFNNAADRFIESVMLLKRGQANHILVSGGNASLTPNPFREATWVKARLNDLSVQDSSIVVENQSRNTLENAAFSKTLLQKRNLKPPYLLFTSAFHMRRAMMIFKHQGIDVIPYPCNYIVDRNGWSVYYLLPSSDALSTWNVYVKEVVGYVVDYFKK